MLVPCFTWVVQSVASTAMSASQRQVYLGDLGRICLVGSVALLPAALDKYTTNYFLLSWYVHSKHAHTLQE